MREKSWKLQLDSSAQNWSQLKGPQKQKQQKQKQQKQKQQKQKLKLLGQSLADQISAPFLWTHGFFVGS